jgi:hypothetical protein
VRGWASSCSSRYRHRRRWRSRRRTPAGAPSSPQDPAAAAFVPRSLRAKDSEGFGRSVLGCVRPGASEACGATLKGCRDRVERGGREKPDHVAHVNWSIEGRISPDLCRGCLRDVTGGHRPPCCRADQPVPSISSIPTAGSATSRYSIIRSGSDGWSVVQRLDAPTTPWTDSVPPSLSMNPQSHSPVPPG